MLKGKNVLITGASAGIGKAIAENFAENSANLILVARRKDKLDSLSTNLRNKYKINIVTLNVDIRSFDKIESAIKSLPDGFRKIDILINNAGKAKGLDKIHEGNINHWDEMIDTNIKGLLYFTKCISPQMVERHDGHIINIGSIAGIEVYPGGNVYCGTKFAVRALSKGMVIDLNGTGVKVTNIQPGLVETEFSGVRFDGDSERAKSTYQGYNPLQAEDIADIALFCVTRKSRVMIQEITVTPTDQASAMVLNKKT